MRQRKVSDQVRRRSAKACQNCRRRKEKCDGSQPCGRCHTRGVDEECHFARDPPFPQGQRPSHFHLSEDMADTREAELAIERLMNLDIDRPEQTSQQSPPQNSERSSAAPVPHLSRLIRDAKGKFMFIGDSANLSFLQNIRRLVETSIGTCTFSADPMRYLMVEDTPEGHPHWLDAHLQGTVLKPGLDRATQLVRQYMLATNCVLDLFDESELLEQLPQWLDGTPETVDSYSSLYYLILAIGAQTSPEDQDDIAQSYFNYGRYLTALRFMDDPSILAVQAYALITMFMLGASRRNAAFMNLGIAVRAAYALGLHRREVSDLFSANERRTRERLWKSIRILDLFMSASLGRPPSTSETRDTTCKDNYSASTRLCAIFETILTEVYSKRMVSTEVVESISEQHRQWTARLLEGFGVDGIQPTEDLLSGQHPNIGLCHVKEAYYWTIVLLTRPFLIEHVSCHIAMSASDEGDISEEQSTTASNQTLVAACVDSAVRTIDLLRTLERFDQIPKRLPFVVNSIFVSALVLGIAVFGDLDRSFPLKQGLRDARTLLHLFHRHDTLAKRSLMIVEYLDTACNTYTDRRDRRRMEGHSRIVGGIFGNLDRPGAPETQQNLASNMRNGSGQLDQMVQDSNYDARNLQDPRADQAHLSSLNDRSEGHNAPSSWTGAQQALEAVYPGEKNHTLPSGFDAYLNPASILSPQTLWFDSFEENLPLFSTLHTGQFRQQ